MIEFNNDEKYKYVSDDLYGNVIFDDNDNEISNDISRKVRTEDEIKELYEIYKKFMDDMKYDNFDKYFEEYLQIK